MRLSLGYQVLFAILFGALTGLFLGSFANALQPVSDIYTMLLQMVALPYICVSLIHGLGSMTPSLGRKLLKRVWFFWLILWGSLLFIIFILSFLIPSPSFTIIKVPSHENADLIRSFLQYLVPDNPLYDLVNNIIPALILFGLVFGIALMHLRAKEPLLSIMGRSTDLMEKILIWLALISPFWIFIRCTIAFGTLYLEDISSLGVYIIGFLIASLFLTFWVLPALLSSFTHLSYREVLQAFKSVCLLPFATGLPTLVLPLGITYIKTLNKTCKKKDHFHSLSETALPLCYSFGQIGNGMILFFLLFMSFFFRNPFSGWEKAILSIFMIPMSFGSSITSPNVVAYLIKQLQLPPESSLFFQRSSLVTLNFQVLMSTASILTFLIFMVHAYYERIRWRRGYFLLHSSLFCIALIGLTGLIKIILPTGDYFYREYMGFRIEDVLIDPVHARIFNNKESPPISSEISDPFMRIFRSGILRIGYSTLDPPYSYINENGEVAGYDIAYAYQLAKDLDCVLELVPIRLGDLAHQLETGEFDIAMASMIMNEDRIKTMEFTASYKEEDFVLVVPAAHRDRFFDLDRLQKNASLKLIAYGALASPAHRYFPLASIQTMENYDPLLEALLQEKVDASFWTRTQAIAWCSSHTDFIPIDYGGAIGRCLFAYPVKFGAFAWASFLNHWLSLKRQDGFQAAMYRYWIKGEAAERTEPRWSILRNVLHWVD